LILWTLPTKILNFSFTMYISWVITRPVFFTKCYDMEVGENRVCILWYREERRRKTRDIYRRHQPLQPWPCIRPVSCTSVTQKPTLREPGPARWDSGYGRQNLFLNRGG
jgi:hypothetical protein